MLRGNILTLATTHAYFFIRFERIFRVSVSVHEIAITAINPVLTAHRKFFINH